MTADHSRRDVLKLLGLVGLTWAAAQVLAPSRPANEHFDPNSPLTPLLPHYFNSTRRNILTHNGQRAILSSPLYPKATFMRDAFYGPLALNDLGLSIDCYDWFARTQQRGTGQIRTAVPFEAADEGEFIPGDDDSTLLFIIWSAWLWRNRHPIDPAAIQQAYAFVRAHVQDECFVTPAGAFRYWADTVKFETPERVAHNQGLYVLALRALRTIGLAEISEAHIARAKTQYQRFYRADLGALTLGQDSWWADKLDLSALFPEFMLRWLYDDTALPDDVVRSTVDRFRQVAVVTTASDQIAGLKIICAADGAFLDRERFFEPGLNWPGDYQNGGYWPMYTLTALALDYRLTRAAATKYLIEQLVLQELALDHVSKEVIRLSPGAVGTFEGQRVQYTWNALIVPALKWAGVV